MEQQAPNNKRFQPYARPAQRRQQPEPTFNEDNFQNIPQVIVGLVKKSLSWLGIAQVPDFGLGTSTGDSHRNGEASTSGGEGGASETSPSSTLEKLYPDLRDFIASMKSSKDDRGRNRQSKRPEYEMDTTPDTLESEQPEQHRAKVRRELSESLDEPSNVKVILPSSNIDLDAGVGHSGTKDVKESQGPSLGTEKASDHMDESEEGVDGLQKDDLVWLPRIRKLTETPLERARRLAQVAEQRRREESLVREPPSAYSIIRRAREDVEPAPQPTPKPSDVSFPYNKDYRRNRQNASIRDTHNDYVMNSGDSGSDADESEHATKGSRERSRSYSNVRPREKPTENLQGTSGKHRPTPRTETLEDQRTSRGGLQIRSQVATKRHTRHIPGRFSALDSDEEEESLRQEEVAREHRRAQRPSIAGVWDTLSNIVHPDSEQQQQQSQGPAGKVPPQIYPTLQYGQRTKLYNPKLDEILKWTSSGHESNPVADAMSSIKHKIEQKIEQKIGFASPVVSEVVSAAPAIIGTIAAAAGAAGVAKVASDWASAGIKFPDNSNKWKCPTCSSMNDNKLDKCAACEESKPGTKAPASDSPAAPPALFTSSYLARAAEAPSTATTAPLIGSEKLDADKDKGNEAAKEEVKTSEAQKPQEKKLAPAITWAAAGFKAPDNSNKWKCPTCAVMNENDKSQCPCCETDKPGAKPAVQKPIAVPALFGSSFGAPPTATPSTTGPAVPPAFSFGAPPSSSSSTTTTGSAPKVPAVPSLFAFGPPASAPPAASASTAAPVAEKPVEKGAEKPADKPAGSWGVYGFKLPDNSNKWKCPTCAVMNDNNHDKCPCCETDKPGGAPKSTPAPAVPSLFGFKPAATTPAPSQALAGETKVPSLFGAPPAAVDSEKKQPTFAFGAPAAATGDSKTPPAMSFGSPFGAKPPSGPAPTLFGSTASSATSEEAKKTAQPAFAFGGTTASTPTPTSAPASAPTPTTSTFTVPATTSLFGSSLSTPAVSLFGSAPSTSTPTSTSTATTAPASGSLFGTPPATSATPTPLFGGGGGPFGGSAPATSASTPASAAPTFSFSATTSSTPSPAVSSSQGLFGASSTTPSTTPSTTTSTTSAINAAAPAFGSVTPSPFAFGSSSNVTFGQSTPSTTSTASSTPPTSAPAFKFGSSGAPGAPAGSGTGSTFGSGLGGFGASTSTTASPFSTTAAAASPFSTSTPASTATTTATTTAPAFSFGGTSTTPATSQSPAKFPFGSSTPSTGASSGGFGTGSTTPSFPFGSSTPGTGAPTSVAGSGFGGFGSSSTPGSSNSMMSPKLPGPLSTTGSGTGGFTFGSGTQSTGMSFGGATSTPGFGGGSSNPTPAFGSSGFGSGPSTQSGGFGSTAGGTQGSTFGQTSSGFGGQTSGFGSSTGAGFGASGTSGFGGANNSTGFISIAGSSGTSQGFGGATSGFGGGMQQPQGTTFGGFGANGANDGKFGFQNMANAPGGSQYPQQQPGIQQPPGGFSFNMGTGPVPGEMPANRKIAKMRTKKR
ncbi:hypothetical protein BGX31_000688 [Mortierella sp. GBA43]|nr:hypothetical protein BGX31_000688 [Mortierella sp. GBA43]